MASRSVMQQTEFKDLNNEDSRHIVTVHHLKKLMLDQSLLNDDGLMILSQLPDLTEINVRSIKVTSDRIAAFNDKRPQSTVVE